MWFSQGDARRHRGPRREGVARPRSTRIEPLEARRMLHEGEVVDVDGQVEAEPWLDHMLDDTAAVDAAAANPPVTNPIAAPLAVGSQPSDVGQWGALENFQIEFINAVMLPTGKVLGYDRTLNLRLWDPATDTFTTPASPGYNFFCSGMAMMADGSVLITGGTVVNYVGLPFAAIYNPFTDSWTQTENMNDGRWYPSTTTLANGDLLVLSGNTNGNTVDPLPQIYDPNTGAWRDLTTALQSLSVYPRTFSAPNGDAFVAGPDPLSQYLDTSGTGQWIPVAYRVQPLRDYGSAVMYAPGKVLYVGGGQPASASAEVIDLTQPNPQWRSVGSMAFARRNCTATLLPDGEVLIVGGNDGSGNYDGNDVMATEIWNPQTEQFTTLSNMSDIRWYHSSALLLPDGRVLSTSGDMHLTGQVFSPPYLFQGAQPTITSAPQTVEYGDNFFVGSPDAANITAATWVRMGSSTHAQNWDQYFQQVSVTQAPGGVNVPAPITPNASPPGYYMLFVLKGNVPSVAKIIHVGQTLPTLVVSDSTATEGATGNVVNEVFTVSLSLASANTITVAFATASGTAQAGTDFTATNGLLTFSPLVTSQVVTVAVAGDGVAESNESFSLNLSAATNAGIVKAQGTGLIRDFNAVPVLQIAGPASVVEGDAGTTAAVYTVNLSTASTSPVTVAYTTVDGTAVSGNDYQARSGVLSFAPGTTQQTITVPVVGDAIDEYNETFSVQLSAPSGATLDVAQAQTLIYNNDAPPSVNLQETATINEPAAGSVANLILTMSLSAPSAKVVVAPWIMNVDGTAINGVNYADVAGYVTFQPGSTSQLLTVPVLGDGIKTPNEAFSVITQYELANCNPGNTYCYVTLVNTDTVPAVSVSNATVTEGNSGTLNLVFTATLSAAVAQAVTVAFQTSAGTATVATDYTETNGLISFAANTTTKVFTVVVRGDTTVESNETFNVTLSNPTGAVLAVSKAVGTIVDNDSTSVPAIPANVSAVAGFQSTGLSWQAVPNATSYRIYRSTTPNGEGTTPVATGVTGTFYSDTNLTNGTKYYYRVTAVRTIGATSYEGSASSEVVITPVTYDFPVGFFSATPVGSVFGSSLFSLNGRNVFDNRVANATLQLTDGGTNQTDSAFTQLPVNIAQFNTQFTFQQTPSYNYTGQLADGMTFTIQRAGVTALGASGGGLGYYGIPNSVAIKFDVHDNGGEGANSTGLFTNGANPTLAGSIDLAGSGIDLQSGHVFLAALSYDGTNLQVTITDTVTAASYTKVYAINIPAVIGGNTAYVGFTAATGNLTAVQKIMTWTFNPGQVATQPVPTAPTGLAITSGTATPVVLSWTNTDPTATSVLIERKTGAAGTYAQIGSTANGTLTTYSDTTANGGTTYYYRVRAFNAGGASPYSGEVSVSTAGATPSLNFANGFAGQAAQFTFNGAAAKLSGSALQLTDGGSSQATSIFANTLVDVSNFSTQFTFQQLAGTSFTADGMTFTIQKNGPTAVGGPGGGLGSTGIANGVAIKFDLFNNLGEGDDSTGLFTNGAAPNNVGSIDLSSTGIDLHSGHSFRAALVYNGTVLQVTITDLTTQATATQSYTVNIPAILGTNSAYVGFTGGTGGLTAIQNVLNWTYGPNGVQIPQADLQINTTDGQTSAVPGTLVSYTVVVTNAGPSAVTGATVTDTLPATLTGVTYTATTTGGATGFIANGTGNIANTVNLPVGSTITYLVSGTLSPTATGTLANTATIAVPSGVNDPTAANNSTTDSDTITPRADLQITNTDGQTTAVPGTVVSYTVVVTNAGPSAVTGATVTDTLPVTLTAVTYTATATGGATGFTVSGTGNIANTVTLPVGSTITYVVSGTLGATATGTLANTATVAVPAGVTDPTAANNTATDSDTITPQADLQITNADGQTIAVPGTLVSYTVIVTNAGPSAVTGATVTDTLPATLTGVAYTATATGGATGFTASGSGNIANTVNLPVGSTITYVVTATLSPTATGILANMATVAVPAGVTDATTANNTATDSDTIAPQADLQITNTDGQASAVPGTLVSYTVVVTNAGPSAVTGATVTDTLPATLTGVTYTATATGGAAGFTASGSGNIANTVTMPVGSTLTYLVSGTLSSTATGTLANTATVAVPADVTDSTAANNTATDSDTLTPHADLQITSTDGQTIYLPGGPVTYTVIVTNAGPSSVTGATVADTLPAALTGVTFTATPTGGAAGFTGSGTGNIDDQVNLPAGATITYVVQATVSPSATGTLSNTATIAAPAGVTDPVLANNTATDNDTLTPEADLQITNTDGQANAVPNGLITYTIVVTNAGPSTVAGATVTDTLPATLTGVVYTAMAAGGATGFTVSGSGNLADTVTLPAGSTITYLISGTLAATATGTLANTASVAVPAEVTDPTPGNNSATDTDTITPHADLQITNTDGQTSAVPGSLVSYTVVVTNAGPSSVTGATVSDNLPVTLTGVTYTATATGGATGFTANGAGNISNTVTLPASSTITYVVEGTLSAAATGTLANTATVTVPADVTDPTPGNNSATDMDTIAPQADLQITNTDGQTSTVPGTLVTYTVVVTNAGPSNVTGATVTDTLPASMTGVTYAATATGGATGFTASGTGSITNTVTMPAGSTIMYVVSGMLSSTATGTLSNTATVAAPAGSTDPTPSNNSATDSDTLTPQADLQITNTDGQASAVPGALVTYTVVVTNAGPSSVTGATVTDTLPATLTGVTYTATATGSATGFTASGTGNIANTVTMPAGSTITYVVRGTLSPAASGTLANTATIAAPAGVTDSIAANNSATDSDTATPQADLQITNTDGQTAVAAGSLVTYTVVVTNAGPSSVTGATVTDILPATLIGVTYTATGTGVASGFTASGSGNIADTVTMPTGSTITYVVRGTLIASATGALSNTATVAAPAGVTDSTVANNSANDSDTISPQADLQITNTDGQTSAVAGALVTYTIVVTNAGPSSVTGATVSDTLPAAISAVTYTATATGGATGFTASGSGNVANTVSMPAGSAITYVVRGTLISSATGTLTNTATVAAPAGVSDPTAGNNSATDSDTITAQADLQITNTDSQTIAVPGTLVTYTIVVTNAGPSNVSGATVTDTLPATLSAVTYTATATGGATGFTASGSGNVANTVALPAGSTVTYVVRGTLSASATGTLGNTATVAAPAGVTDSIPANNSATDSDTITPQADLQITNTDGQTSAVQGSLVSYTIVVTNAGPSSVTGASVTDTLPATLTGVTYTATATGGAAGFTASGSGNVANTVSMPVGSTITYVVRGTLSASATGTLSNTATVAAPAGVTDPTAANNSVTDSDTITISTTPAINFPSGFSGATSQFSFNGTSTKISGTSLQLTAAANQAASIFYRTAVNVQSFSTSFNIQQLTGSSFTADGMTFTLQGTSIAAKGGTGGNLGYNGIAKSVAIKFDLFNNNGEGDDSTGLFTNGAAPTSANSVNLTGTGIDFHSGHTFNVSIVYNGTTLTVTITDLTTQAKATQNYTVNIPSIVGGNTAFVGFTGGTGSFYATQNIVNWTYTVTSGGTPAARAAAGAVAPTIGTSSVPTASPLATAVATALAKSTVATAPPVSSNPFEGLLIPGISHAPRVKKSAAVHDAVIAGTHFWRPFDGL